MYYDNVKHPNGLSEGIRVRLVDDMLVEGVIISIVEPETDYDDDAMRPVTSPPVIRVRWLDDGGTEDFTGSWVVHTEDDWQFEELSRVG